MNYPSKSQVNVAASKLNRFDLSKQVVTTSDFGRIKPIECRYMVPGDEFNVKVSSFTRLAPMPAPTFGKIDTIQRAYFVPIRSISRDFYKELSNQPFPRGRSFETGSRVPRMVMYNFVTMFCQLEYSTLIKADGEDVTPPDSFDFYIEPGYNQVIFSNEGDYDPLHTFSTLTTGGWFNFTNKGRKLFDFYTSLGFNISFDMSYRSEIISLFPILAFWKSYFDWVIPARFLKEYPYSIQGFIEKCIVSNVWSLTWNTAGTIADMVAYFGRVPLAFYDNDVFTSGWLNPFNPDLKRIDINIPNPAFTDTYQLNGVTTRSIGTENGVGAHIDVGAGSTKNTYNNDYINYFTIESLGKLQDYLNRGMLAGSKVQDWLLTEFGIRPSTDALDLSTYLGKIQDTIRIGDIMSNADTRNLDGTLGQPLGSYAGQAKGGTVGMFKYKAKEHGYFIITTEIIPKTSYYQGLTPEFQMKDITDFFQPEFDNLGVQAVAYKDMLSVARHYEHHDGTTIDPNSIFCFVPRYALLKTSFDVVSGDFRNRFGEILKSWWLGRDVEKFIHDGVVNGDGVVNLDFCSVDPDQQQWDSIFNYDESDVDHFYQIFVIENSARRPMLSIAEAFNPEHPNGNKSVEINTNGNRD